MRQGIPGLLVAVLFGGCVVVGNDPCDNGGGCDANATCSDHNGAAECTCNSGFTGDGTSCTAVGDACSNGGGCDTNATCADSGGTAVCTCNAGFSGDGTTCTADVDPYDTCNSGDECSGGLACLVTTLPASSGFTGSFCSSTCGSDSDCVQLPTNFAASCVDGQCYLTCPSDDTCPFGQSCLAFQDQNGNEVDLCSP